jgi:Mitochondrial large subunit ribosomal protein (Img2)
MFRRSVIDSVVIVRGRPWKKRGMPIAVHAAVRPAKESNVDFSSLGLTYQVTQKPIALIKETHWTEPPSSEPTAIPFFVERTSVGASLPVYTDYKAGNTKVVTILRKCRGDIQALKLDMELVCGKEVTVRAGKLVVDGNYQMRIKKWLSGLGF